MTNLIFDMGQVLLHFEPLNYLLPSGLAIDQVLQLHDLIFKSPTWLEIDAGRYTIDQATDLFASKSALPKPIIHQVLTEWSDSLLAYPTTQNALIRLTDLGYDLYYLTNFPDYAFDRTFARLDLLKYFKGGICSAKVKLAKPDPAIFELLLKTCGLKASDSLFVDDNADNIQTAQKLGFQTIHYQGPKDMADLIKHCTDLSLL